MPPRAPLYEKNVSTLRSNSTPRASPLTRSSSTPIQCSSPTVSPARSPTAWAPRTTPCQNLTIDNSPNSSHDRRHCSVVTRGCRSRPGANVACTLLWISPHGDQDSAHCDARRRLRAPETMSAASLTSTFIGAAHSRTTAASRAFAKHTNYARNGARCTAFFNRFRQDSTSAGIVGSQGRDDYDVDDVEHYFNYMGCLAVVASSRCRSARYVRRAHRNGSTTKAKRAMDSHTFHALSRPSPRDNAPQTCAVDRHARYAAMCSTYVTHASARSREAGSARSGVEA